MSITIEEAINRISEVIKSNNKNGGVYLYPKDREALALSITALKKQLPTIPEYTIFEYRLNGEQLKIKNPECPRCRRMGVPLWEASANMEDEYCQMCGQKFDWEHYERSINEEP